jgi:hypothetical protein
LSWNSRDLQNKLDLFQAYYKKEGIHLGIKDEFPDDKDTDQKSPPLKIRDLSWNPHCRGLLKARKTA